MSITVGPSLITLELVGIAESEAAAERLLKQVLKVPEPYEIGPLASGGVVAAITSAGAVTAGGGDGVDAGSAGEGAGVSDATGSTGTAYATGTAGCTLAGAPMPEREPGEHSRPRRPSRSRLDPPDLP